MELTQASPNGSPREPREHVAAAATALGLIALIIAVGLLFAVRFERHALRAVAPKNFELKNHGLALQREAFRHDDLLPLYGSSELMKRVPGKAGDFFRREPTGFEVFPVGKAGTTSLVVLQKLVALGTDLHGRKLAFSISPSWFSTREIEPHQYAGNFSLEQATSVAFSTKLNHTLKCDIARRLLDYPEPLAKSPVLTFGLSHLAGEHWVDRALYWLAWPLGQIEGALLRVQDHFHTFAFLLQHRHHLAFRPRPAELDWAQLLARAAQDESASEEAQMESDMSSKHDDHFLRRLDQSREWGDLELLLRGLRQLGARPLLLSMPINGAYLDRLHISAQARAVYYDRLEALAAAYGVPLVDFRDHDEDPAFLRDTRDHLSAKGWLYFDAAIDAFYHDRPLAFPPRPQSVE
jgi:D-alanine transfer protein